MAADKIDVVDDARISHRTADLNGRTYHYLYAEPKGDFKATVFLVHGWPDISIGWRYQIPAFLELGYRVVCPDMMGYGGTDAPHVPPESLSLYGFKRAADDIKELARQLGAPQIILGGHDWGGAIVYRVALWYPELVSFLFSVCTPYWAPTKEEYLTLQDLVKYKLPHFGYQLHLSSGEVEKAIDSNDKIGEFLNGMYGGKGLKGEVGFNPRTGILFDNLPKLAATPLLSGKELDYYTGEYARHGMHGTLNWYRTRELNYNEELELHKTTIEIPTLFILATKDGVLTPELSYGMEKYFSKLTRKEVPASHWALWEAPEQVNGFLKEWLNTVAFGEAKSSL
ncbi:hypothetical protein MMC30_005212 [Trapelia coarctata]|nr:hypothetical protein [Trapelia coarctata]